MKKEHPPLKDKQLARIKLEIACFADDFYCDLSDISTFETMIKFHFKRTDGLNTDLILIILRPEGSCKTYFINIAIKFNKSEQT